MPCSESIGIMNSLSLKLISLLLWTWFLVSSFIFTPVILLIWVLTIWWDKRRLVLHRFSCFWGAQYIWVNPLWKLRISGREKINEKLPVIFVCNHQSLVDIVVIYSLFRHFKWTSKVENFRLPFVGWVLALNRSVKIFRGKKEAYEAFFRQAERELKLGSSLMVFPEGTRSPTGDPGPFKDGAFRLAHETGSGIQPLVLDGSSKAIPKKGWSLTGKTEIRLKVLDFVPYSFFENKDIKETTAYFRNTIVTELQNIRKVGN